MHLEEGKLTLVVNRPKEREFFIVSILPIDHMVSVPNTPSAKFSIRLRRIASSCDSWHTNQYGHMERKGLDTA